MKIKIFEGNSNNESDINKWLFENQDIEIVKVEMIPMYDFYQDDEPRICNQWIATIIIYK